MKTRSWRHLALAIPAFVLSHEVLCDTGSSSLQPAQRVLVADDVYIKQAHGRVSPGTKIFPKPVPEAITAGTPSSGPTAPATCDAQNASSPACYTATQQTRSR